MSDTKNNTITAHSTALMHFMQSTTALSARIVYCGLGALTLTAAATDNANAIVASLPTPAKSSCVTNGTNCATAGKATVSNSGNTVTVTQTTNKAVIDWSNFNTTAGESVVFVQPNTSAIALNRISGGATSFKGTLASNGNVWLINPDGFLFNKTSSIQVGGLLLSTAGISTATTTGFYTNTTKEYTFDQPGNPNASIQLDGTIVDAIGGNIIIQAPAVAITNGSILSTSGGNIALGAGQTFDFDDGLVHFQYNVDSSDAQMVTGLPPETGGLTYPIYVGGNGSSSKNPTTLNATGGVAGADGKIIVAVDIDPNLAYDHVINLGGQFDGAYDRKSNPEGVVITPKPKAQIAFSPAPTPAPTSSPSPTPAPTPSPTPAPTSAPAPAPTPAPAPAPVSLNLPLTQQDLFTVPLTRQFTSLGSETVLDTTVNPLVANVSYERPYTVSLPVSFADGKLSLFSQNTANLANIAPAAGGSNPADLSPSAGGNNPADLSPSAGGASSSIACANAYLDMQWAVSPAQRPCDK